MNDTQHLSSPDLGFRMALAARYVHGFFHVIEIGGGENPIYYELTRFKQRPQTYVCIDPRYKTEEELKTPTVDDEYYKPLPIPTFDASGRAIGGWHYEHCATEFEKCIRSSGTVAAVVLGCSIENNYYSFLEFAFRCDRVVFEYRVGKDRSSIKNFENDMLVNGFTKTLFLPYEVLEHKRHFLVLDKPRS